MNKAEFEKLDNMSNEQLENIIKQPQSHDGEVVKFANEILKLRGCNKYFTKSLSHTESEEETRLNKHIAKIANDIGVIKFCIVLLTAIIGVGVFISFVMALASSVTP